MAATPRGYPTSPPDSPPNNLLPHVRELVSRYPSLARGGPEEVHQALRLWGIKADPPAVEAALEALQIEGVVLP